jgi:hypothetical protein
METPMPIDMTALLTGITGIVMAIAAVVKAFSTGRSLKEEQEEREKLELKLAKAEARIGEEQQKRFDCMREVAELRGIVSALQSAMRSKGYL